MLLHKIHAVEVHFYVLLFIYLFINHRQQVLGNQSVQSFFNSDTLLSACKFHYTYIITIYSTHVLQAWVKFIEVV